MTNMEDCPKSIKKAIHYIQQDAPPDKLIEIKRLFDYAIQKRLDFSSGKSQTKGGEVI